MAVFALMQGRGRQYQGGVFLTFENDTGYTVDQLYMSPHRSDQWGRDLLGDTTLGNGDRQQR